MVLVEVQISMFSLILEEIIVRLFLQTPTHITPHSIIVAH